jgi:PAS domain-containing protein
MVQAAATETLMQNRVLEPASAWVTVGGLVVIALMAFVIGRTRWYALLGGLVIIALLTEWVALVLQRDFAFVVNTAPWHAALATFAIVVLLSEIDFRELVQTMWRLRASNAEALLAKVVADNFAGVVVVDDTGMIRTASRSASDLLSRPLTGTLARETLPPELMAAIAASGTRASCNSPSVTVSRVPSSTWPRSPRSRAHRRKALSPRCSAS